MTQRLLTALLLSAVAHTTFCYASDGPSLPLNINGNAAVTSATADVTFRVTPVTLHRGTTANRHDTFFTITPVVNHMNSDSRVCFHYTAAADFWVYYPNKSTKNTPWMRLHEHVNGSDVVIADAVTGSPNEARCYTSDELAATTWTVERELSDDAKLVAGLYKLLLRFRVYG